MSTILANVDTPYQGINIPAINLYIAGWVFVGEDGTTPPITGVSFYNYDLNSWYLPNFRIIKGLLRPDVYAAYIGTYPAVTQNEGYHLYFTETPPAGRYRMWVQWSTLDWSTYSQPIEVTLT